MRTELRLVGMMESLHLVPAFSDPLLSMYDGLGWSNLESHEVGEHG